jgi:ketopantoate hydroxymethyltransferase
MTARSSVFTATDLIASRHRHRAANPGRVGIKVNLYHGYELEAVAAAAVDAGLRPDPIECFMVADSYLMTHLGRPTTRLETDEWPWGMDLMCRLVGECRDARDRVYGVGDRPFLLGDLPDGAATTPDRALDSAGRLLRSGAEAIKLELSGKKQLAHVEVLAEAGVPVIAHLGYTPQRGELRRFGKTMEELTALCSLACAVRDRGAVAVVLEMVTEAANRLLTQPDPRALPVYSIFSGRADLGGQSLNVWDSVFRPSRPSQFFPPTATLDSATDRAKYGPEAVRTAMGQLLALTVQGVFPLSPGPAQDLDRLALQRFRPWEADVEAAA